MDTMAEHEEAWDHDEVAAEVEADPELWDWARAAGVSREDLLRALEQLRPE
jgi:hypothetical protein